MGYKAVESDVVVNSQYVFLPDGDKGYPCERTIYYRPTDLCEDPKPRSKKIWLPANCLCWEFVNSYLGEDGYLYYEHNWKPNLEVFQKYVDDNFPNQKYLAEEIDCIHFYLDGGTNLMAVQK